MILFFLLAVPLASAAWSFAARTRASMERINLSASALLFALAAGLAAEVLRAGSVSVWDGFLAADSLSALVVLLTGLVALACSVYAIGYFREDQQNQPELEGLDGGTDLGQLRKYYTQTPLFVFAMLLVAIAGNLG